MSRRTYPIVAVLCLVAAAGILAQQGPTFSPSGPSAAAYGQAEGYPVGNAGTVGEPRFLVGGFSHFDTLFPTRAIDVGRETWAFQRAPERLIRYRRGTDIHTLDDYLALVPVTGLIIAKDDTILTERYQYGRTDRDRFTSQSMSKTIVAMLIGIAVNEHRIASIDDAAGTYATALGQSEYGRTTIRNLLHMSSGVACQTAASSESLTTPGALTATALATCTRVAPAGKVFAYSNLDSQVLGLVVRQAFAAPLASVLHERIWSPMGAEAAGQWTLDADGQETAFCCVNATLRDFARLGRLLAHDGSRDEHAIIPKPWLLDATTVSDRDPQLAPGKSVPFFGYGYQVWILPDERRMFCLIGGNGQRVFVDPASKLVMAQTAVETEEVNRDLDAETIALWLSLVAQFGRLS